MYKRQAIYYTIYHQHICHCYVNILVTVRLINVPGVVVGAMVVVVVSSVVVVIGCVVVCSVVVAMPVVVSSIVVVITIF